MYKPNEDKFVEKSLRFLQNEFVRQGVIVFDIESFRDIVIKIGKLYYDFIRKGEDKFVEKGLRMLRNEFARQGVASFRIEEFRDPIIKMGKLYHEYMKKEEF